MNSNPILCKRKVRNRKTLSSEESDQDDSCLLEERLKNLLTNAGEQRPRNIFNNIQEAPKLRRSVVVRAIENVVSSTPMPTKGKKRDFFCAETSLNISPIDPIAEEVEHHKNEQDKEEDKKTQNQCKQLTKEARVMLTPLPIVVSSDSEDEEVQSIIRGVSNNEEARIHHNSRQMRSSVEKRKNKSGTDVAKCFETDTEHNIAEELQAIVEQSMRNITFRNKSNNTNLSHKNTLSARKNNKSLQQTKSPNRMHVKQTEFELLQARSTNENETQNKSTANTKSMQDNSLKSSNIDGNNAVDDVTLDPIKNNNKCDDIVSRILRSSNYVEDTGECHEKGSLEALGLRKIRQQRENVDSNKSKTKNADNDISGKANNFSNREIDQIMHQSVIKENVAKEVNGYNNSSRESPHEPVSSTDTTNKNSEKEFETQAHRKLSFRSEDEVQCKGNELSVRQTDNKREPHEKLLKISLTRSRSKSKEKNHEENFYQQNELSPLKKPLRKKNVPRQTASPVTTYFSKVGGSSWHCKSQESGKGNASVKRSANDTSEGGSKKHVEVITGGKKGREFAEKKSGFGRELSTTVCHGSRLEELNNKRNRCDIGVNATLDNVDNSKGVKMVEVGTSPLMVTPHENQVVAKRDKSKKTINRDTSTCSLDDERRVIPMADSAKAEKFNQLITRIAQRSRVSSNFPNDCASDDLELRKNSQSNLSPHRPKQHLTLPMINKEVQTQNFEKSDSKSSTSRENSEILRCSEMKGHILFQSLEEDHINFTSDEETDEHTLQPDDPKNHPWRFEDNFNIAPRRSSFHLNFLRSVQEIEMGKDSLGDERTFGAERDRDKKMSSRAQSYSARYTKKNKVQIYSSRKSRRSTKSMKLQSTDSRSLSPKTFMSDLAAPDSDSDTDLESMKLRKQMPLRTNSLRHSEQNQSPENNRTVEKDTTLKTLDQSDADTVFNENDNLENNYSNSHPRKKSALGTDKSQPSEDVRSKKSTSKANKNSTSKASVQINSENILDENNPLENNNSDLPRKESALETNYLPVLEIDHNRKSTRKAYRNTGLERVQSNTEPIELRNDDSNLRLRKESEFSANNSQVLQKGHSSRSTGKANKNTSLKALVQSNVDNVFDDNNRFVNNSNLSSGIESALETNNSQMMEKGQNRKSTRKSNKNTSLKGSLRNNAESVLNEGDNLENNDSELRVRISHSPTRAVSNKSRTDKENYIITRRKEKSSASDDGIANEQIPKPRQANTTIMDKIENVVSDDEILAVPLEDSETVATQDSPEGTVRRSTRHLKSRGGTDVINNNVDGQAVFEPAGENFVKPPSIAVTSTKRNSGASTNKNATRKKTKKNEPKSKKKIVIPENEDGVSCTTMDSGDVTGVRRSGRDRKVIQLRRMGTFLTYREKDYQYFSRLTSVPCSTDSTLKQSETKKKRSSEKTSNSQLMIDPETQKNKPRRRGRPKKVDKSPKKPRNTNKSTKASNKSNDIQSNEPDSSQAEINKTAINRASSTKTMTPKKKKHSADCVESAQNIIPNKRNKTMNSSCQDPESDKTNRDASSPSRTNDNRLISDDASTCHLDNTGDANISTNDGNGIRSGIPDTFHNSSLLRTERNEENCVFYGGSPQDNLNSVGELVNDNQMVDRDSGRSTMLKSTSLEESNVRICKPLTGRVSKNYKRKENVCTKISKVLSRSINLSREREIVSEIEANAVGEVNGEREGVRSKRASVIQSNLEDGEYVTVLSNNNLINMRYVDRVPKFKLVKDNLMVADSIRNTRDGYSMGYLKLPPASNKALHIARKFALAYCVIAGEGFIQVHNMTSKVGKYSSFVIPLGVEYSIHNTSKDTSMLLSFVKVTSTEGSQSNVP